MPKPILVNINVINRPLTTEKCIKQLLKNTDRSKITLCVNDQNSNEQTKEVLYRYKLEFDIFNENGWNIGCAFSINQGMANLQPGQHFLDANQDTHVYNDDWLDIFMDIAQDTDIGVIAARRPTFWIDGKYDPTGVVFGEQRHGYWCEVILNSLIVGPFWLIKSNVIKEIGYMNEATGYDDIDFYKRVHQKCYVSCYVPDVIIKQPQDEVQNHPQYGSHQALLKKNWLYHNKYISSYLQNKDLYCGTRWKPETIEQCPDEYRKMSESNWEFLRNWRREDEQS